MDGPMRRSLTLALSVVLLVSACGVVRNSKLNPFNWFGRSQPAEVVQLGQKPADPRLLVEQLTQMSVEPYSGGAIVRATGITPSQGWWDAELVEVETDDPSHLVLEFRLYPPVTNTPVNTPRSREVTVATTVSTIRLETVSKITVQGANSARTTRR